MIDGYRAVEGLLGSCGKEKKGMLELAQDMRRIGGVCVRRGITAQVES